MHRVELKGRKHKTVCIVYCIVPNAPCGVESVMRARYRAQSQGSFLMHRVELKERETFF